MGRKYRRILEEEDVQQRRLSIAEREDSGSPAHETAESSSHSILNLQRSIGNQAVQRYIVQRDPKPKVRSSDEQPSAVATITGAQRGKFKGTSRVVGHEGKIEILGLQFKPEASKMTVILYKRVDESSQAFMMAFQNGERLTTAQFMGIRHDENGNVETVMTYDFSDGYVTGVQMSTSQGIPYEAITLEFDLKKDKEKE
ncbi:MAG: type VI secretion system tube protein Hcp [Anaerolineae bacterium]|nr:type VI secretion system tube protein Hcp [Anaerolineae bacterium]